MLREVEYHQHRGDAAELDMAVLREVAYKMKSRGQWTDLFGIPSTF